MNQVILTGNITKEILTKDTTKGKVANFTIANNRGEIASFFDCIAFDKRAETISTYCKKGDKVLIRGELTQDRWTAQDGTSRTAIRIIKIVSNIIYINTKLQWRYESSGNSIDAKEPLYCELKFFVILGLILPDW